MRFQNLFNVTQQGAWQRWDVNPKIWPESMCLTSLLHDVLCILLVNERCIVIPVRTTPTREGSRVRIPGERTAPLALELAGLPRAGLPRERGGTAGLRPPGAGLSSFALFKANCLCCQERVCPSLGDSGRQAQNSKHVKNSSASRPRGCNFLLKCRLRSRQESRALSLLPAACSGGC